MVGILKLDKTKTSVTTLILLYIFCYTYFYDNNDYSEFNIPKPAMQEDVKVWASMGLCYSHNTELHGKSRYPYKNVAPLALLLWRYHLPSVHTIVRIVYTEPSVNGFMKLYGDMLERTGAVVEWVPSGNMDCVLKSQMIRMFAAENSHVSDTDIVVTVDINLFVMTPKILQFLDQYPGMKVWIPQYHDTADISTGTGETFNLNLIAMRAGAWKQITGYNDVGGDLEKLIQHFRNASVLDPRDTWYTDQLITTYTLLSNRICTVPEISGLWNLPGLSYDPGFSDEEQCWHGKGFKDCNKDIHIVYQGCKWWHFYPDQSFDDHLEKFYELTNHSIKIDLQQFT